MITVSFVRFPLSPPATGVTGAMANTITAASFTVGFRASSVLSLDFSATMSSSESYRVKLLSREKGARNSTYVYEYLEVNDGECWNRR